METFSALMALGGGGGGGFHRIAVWLCYKQPYYLEYIKLKEKYHNSCNKNL